MNIKNRINQFILQQGITVSEFEQKCGLSNGYIYNMRKGFGNDKLNNVLSQYPQLSRDWLLFGEGDMLVGQATQVPTVNTRPQNTTEQRLLAQVESLTQTNNIHAQNIAELIAQQGRLITLLENSNKK